MGDIDETKECERFDDQALFVNERFSWFVVLMNVIES